METIAILFIFFILVAVGMIFYSKIHVSKIAEKIEEFQELSKIQIAQIASSLPELQCSRFNDIEPNCIDLIKLETAPEIMLSNSDDYFDIFAFSKITVRQIFPKYSNNSSIIYERKPTKINNKLATYFPISLFDPIDQNYYFGVMVVEVYT